MPNHEILTMSKFADARLLLSAGTLPNASFIERVSAAKAAGFTAISLFPQQYLAAQRSEKLSIDDMRNILAEHDIALDEVDPLLDWFGPIASPSEQLMMEMADAFGARSVNVAAAFVSDKPFSEIVDCFGRTCERVAAHGLRADLEFLPWTQVPDLASALTLLEQANPSNAGIMFDFWHFFNGGGQVAQLNALPAESAARITSLQLNDAPNTIAELDRRQHWQFTKIMIKTAVDSIRVMGWKGFTKVAARAQYPHADAQKMMQDALCSRLMPGAGDKPVAQVLSALAEKGVRPAIGVEVFNLTHDHLPAHDIAQSAMRAYRSVIEA